MFQKDACGADWSKAGGLLAYNAKGSDGRYHIYTVQPDGANPVQFALGTPSFPRRTTGTPVSSPSGQFIAFVNGDSYNEHPRYTPDGQVLWMTSTDNPSHGTDWWTMSPDGSNPQRLSDFNADENARAFGHKPVYATTVQTGNRSADRSYFYGDVETNLLNSDAVIARVALTCHGS